MSTAVKKERRQGFVAAGLQDPLLSQLLATKQLYLYATVRPSWMTRHPAQYLAALRPATDHDSEDALLDCLECLLDLPSNAQALMRSPPAFAIRPSRPQLLPSAALRRAKSQFHPAMLASR